jgi:predicted metal-dependent enzyme (double-stranded beta helix superfamily)
VTGSATERVPDAPVRTLLTRIAAPAAASRVDMVAIGDALRELAGDRDYLAGWIARLGDTSGIARIHTPARGPRLMLAHRLTGQMGAVHDHRTWVALAGVTGLETHRRYRVAGPGDAARPVLVEELALAPLDVTALLPPDDLHDHGHLEGRGAPAYVLILTGDDQTRFERTEWDLATGRRRVLRPGDAGRWLASEVMP